MAPVPEAGGDCAGYAAEPRGCHTRKRCVRPELLRHASTRRPALPLVGVVPDQRAFSRLGDCERRRVRDAVLALRAVQGDHPRWCFTYQGEPMRAVGSAWERSLRRAGIEAFRFHDLLHTWASWHVMSGTSLQELMELGGWKSYEMVLGTRTWRRSICRRRPSGSDGRGASWTVTLRFPYARQHKGLRANVSP